MINASHLLLLEYVLNMKLYRFTIFQAGKSFFSITENEIGFIFSLNLETPTMARQFQS